MRTTFLAIGATLLMMGTAIRAQESVLAVDEDTAVMPDESTNDATPDAWRFLGCVRNQWECQRLAHRYGFHRSSARFDFRTCGIRQGLACYGWYGRF